MVDFQEAATRCLRQIPHGRVAACGAIARALGDVRAARAVYAWLLERPETPGGHRVVRADGRLVLPQAKARLSLEGVRFERGRVIRQDIFDSFNPVGFLDALRQEQRRLSSRVIETDDERPIQRIGGVDIAYDADRMYAAAVCIDAKDLRILEVATVTCGVSFPYIPTFLAYREFPGIDATIRRLSTPPDVLLIDGHGRLHPSLYGIACDVGVRLDVPTIGVGKHPLVGRPSIGSKRTDHAIAMKVDGRTRGYAWIPPGRGRPIFVSIGHRISLETALAIVRGTTRQGYPEPLKIADRLCGEMKRNEKREKGAKR